MTMKELKIGTYENVITAKPEDKLHSILTIFSTKSISSVPIVNDDGSYPKQYIYLIGVVIDVYARTDVINLAKTFDLNITVGEALKYRKSVSFPAATNQSSILF